MGIENIVRIGRVTAVDSIKHIARVWFDAMGIESGWLPVLITKDYIPDHSITPYMPKVNETVLVLYIPVFNGDGVILGGVQPWR